MHILIINQFIPPDPSPTARLVQDLNQHFTNSGHSVHMVSAGGDYRKRAKHKAARWIREITSLGKVFLRSLSGKSPDVIISLSSPPCLLVLATVIAKLRNAKSIHWAMDLYPELALALGEIKAGALYSITLSLMKWGYQNTAVTIALDKDMQQHLSQYGIKPEIIPPWLISPPPPLPFSQFKIQNSKFQVLYSGNLGRAHEWLDLIKAQKILESRDVPVSLIFQGGGASYELAKDEASRLSLQHCHFRDYLPADELSASLLSADVLAVTQKPEACGLLWPSKLTLVSRLPRPVLWIGRTDGDIAKQLARTPGNGVFEPGESEQIANWLERIHTHPQSPIKEFPNQELIREPGLSAWNQILSSLET